MIVNRKTVDPRDPESPPVLQLESAMGAAIGSFPGARLLQVPRTRFVPVKTTDDLLVLRSDAYALGDEFRVEPAAGPDGRPPFVALDKALLRADRRLRAAASRRDRRRCVRPSAWWSTATSASAPAWSSAAPSSSRRRPEACASPTARCCGTAEGRAWPASRSSASGLSPSRCPPEALAAPGERIEQGYLTIGSDGAETRVRRRGERCTLTVKSGSGLVRSEHEVELTAEQFEALWPATEGARVEKVRHAPAGR